MNVAERAMNPFAAYLAQAAALVEAELDAIFVEEKARLDAQTPELASLFEQVRALTSRGGKRLRAALVLLGYRAFGGEGERAALPAARMNAPAIMNRLIVEKLLHVSGCDHTGASASTMPLLVM